MAASRLKNPPSAAKPQTPALPPTQTVTDKANKTVGTHPTSGSRPRLPTDGTFGANKKQFPQ